MSVSREVCKTIKAGTKIIITNGDSPSNLYENGDILEVTCDGIEYGGRGVGVNLGKSNAYYVYIGEFDIYTETVVGPIKVGDYVEVTGAFNSKYNGVAGTVVEIRSNTLVHFTPEVNPKGVIGNTTASFYPNQLTIKNRPQAQAPRTISMADIQIGDKIRAVYTLGEVAVTREGVVTNTIANVSAVSSGVHLASRNWKNVVYTLLYRPEPVGNTFADASIGSLALEVDGWVWTKVSTNTWKFIRNGVPSITSCTDYDLNNDKFTLTYVAEVAQ